MTAVENPMLRRQVGLWLAAWAVMLLLTVVVGGVTRLTESGLSITEWRPVTGILPPLSQREWNEEFSRYQQIPEYQQVNAGMTLAGFKRIFLVEYVHRLWARLVGLAFAVPLLVFLLRGARGAPLPSGGVLGARLRWRLIALLVLTGLQGAMGWYMVKSGLTGRTDVSQYRLAAHLSLALVIFGLTVWTAADLLTTRARTEPAGSHQHFRRYAAGFAGLVFLTAIAGAFVAGLDAGKAYNTFPLMGGRIVPAGYLQLQPWYRNFFEHVPAVQFNHRVLGLIVIASALGLWLAARRAELPASARRLAGWIAVMALVQVSLGISTLLLKVPIPVAALHQAGAVILLALALLLLHALGSPDASGTRRLPDA